MLPPGHTPINPSSHVLAQFSLKGKVAAVTGGAGGIGQEIVRGLAEAGADVALIYHSSLSAPQLAAEIASQNGVSVKAYQADVTIKSSIATVLSTIAQDFGHLDVVVVNAGVCSNVKSLEYTEDLWRHINTVNFDGAMWTAQAAGKIFKTQGWGNLIITASVSSVLVNFPQEQAAYNASKAAVAHLGKCLAVEWAGFARVNMVSPGYIATDMVLKQPSILMKTWLSQVPQGRIAKPEELKGLYTFLASDACPYMTGANIIVDGAYSCI